MPQNLTLKKGLMAGIAALMALFSFLMLFFAIYATDYGIYSDTGFTWLSMGSDLIKIQPYTSIAFLLSFAELLCSFAMIALVCYAFFKGKEHLYKIVFIVSLISMALYMITGFVTPSIFDATYGEKISSVLTTYAYWPFIIGIILTVAYAVIVKKMPDTASTASVSGSTSAQAAKKIFAPVSESENIDNITKYKALLDQGIITQEEFDAKKKDLLCL